MKVLNHTLPLPILFGVLMLGFGLISTAFPLELYLGLGDLSSDTISQLLLNTILVTSIGYGILTIGMLFKQSWSRYAAVIFFFINFVFSNMTMLYFLFGGYIGDSLFIIAAYILAQIFWISILLILNNKSIVHGFRHQDNESLKPNPLFSKIMIGFGVSLFVWSIIALGSLGAIWAYGVMLGITLMLVWGGLFFLDVNQYNIVTLIGIALLSASIAPFMLGTLGGYSPALYIGAIMLPIGVILMMRESWSRGLVSVLLVLIALTAIILALGNVGQLFVHTSSHLLAMGGVVSLAIGGMLFLNQEVVRKGFM